MQLLSLFSTIEENEMPGILLGYYETLGIATLEFLPNIFLYVIPNSTYPKDNPGNKLTTNAKYHPNIFIIRFFNAYKTCYSLTETFDR